MMRADPQMGWGAENLERHQHNVIVFVGRTPTQCECRQRIPSVLFESTHCTPNTSAMARARRMRAACAPHTGCYNTSDALPNLPHTSCLGCMYQCDTRRSMHSPCQEKGYYGKVTPVTHWMRHVPCKHTFCLLAGTCTALLPACKAVLLLVCTNGVHTMLQTLAMRQSWIRHHADSHS
jgi:hypothetical protein